MRDDGDGSIEIELVEHAPSRRRRDAADPPRRPAEVPSGHGPVPGAGPSAPLRLSAARRTVALAAGVGTAGLVIGWLAASAGDGQSAAGSGAPAASTVASSAPVASFADDPALVEPAAPLITSSPDRPRLTTTTTMPEAIAVSPIPDVDSALIGLPYELVTEDGRGQLRFIDLASNTLTTLDAPNGSDTGQLFAGDTWVLVPNASSPRTIVYRDGTPQPYRILDFSPWNVLHAAGAPTMWRPDSRLEAGAPGEMVEIDANGNATGLAVPVPRVPILIDSSGAFVIDAPGGVYTVSAAGTARLTTGELVALGPTVALVTECDETLACTYVVVDRVSGERRPLPGLFGGATIRPLGWWSAGQESISPDGTTAIVMLPTWEDVGGEIMETEPRLFVIHLDSGETTVLEDSRPWLSGVYWTADSQFAFFLTDGELLAYSRELESVIRAGPDETSTRRPQVFAVRPADGTPWLER